MEHFILGTPCDQLRDDIAVEQAIDNLSRFALVGVLENLSTFTSCFQDLYGVPLSIPNWCKNPKAKSEREALITPQIREQVVEICQPGLAVYHAARKMT